MKIVGEEKREKRGVLGLRGAGMVLYRHSLANGESHPLRGRFWYCNPESSGGTALDEDRKPIKGG